MHPSAYNHIVRDVRPRRLFVVGASGIPLLLGLALVVWLFGVKHYHLSMARRMLQAEFVRAYVFNPGFRRLATAIADQRAAESGVFATVWDTSEGVLLSRRLFTPVDMFGVPKYRYKSNLRKLTFRTAAPRLEWDVDDTPAVRTALQGVALEPVAAAAYDDLGFRRVDAEITRDCEVHVLFLGDSFTDGLWVNDSETFVNRYGHAARERSGVRVCPVNAGVNGYGSLEEAYVLEHSFEAAGRPRVVILMYFANDVDADTAALLDGTLPDVERKWGASLAYLRRAAEFSRRRDSTLVIAAIPPADQIARPSTRARYQDVLRRFCERESVRFVDLFDGLAAFDVHDLYWDWDPHFTPRGHEVVADILFEQTRTLLAEARDAHVSLR